MLGKHSDYNHPHYALKHNWSYRTGAIGVGADRTELTRRNIGWLNVHHYKDLSLISCIDRQGTTITVPCQHERNLMDDDGILLEV